MLGVRIQDICQERASKDPLMHLLTSSSPPATMIAQYDRGSSKTWTGAGNQEQGNAMFATTVQHKSGNLLCYAMLRASLGAPLAGMGEGKGQSSRTFRTRVHHLGTNRQKKQRKKKSIASAPLSVPNTHLSWPNDWWRVADSLVSGTPAACFKPVEVRQGRRGRRRQFVEKRAGSSFPLGFEILGTACAVAPFSYQLTHSWLTIFQDPGSNSGERLLRRIRRSL